MHCVFFQPLSKFDVCVLKCDLNLNIIVYIREILEENVRILILSCNTGEGHNAAARAMKQRIEYEGHEAVMLDYMLLKGKRASKIVGNAYIDMAKYAPRLFQMIYHLGLAISSSRRKSPVYWANHYMGKYLKSYLAEHDFDAIIITHLYPAEALTYLKRHGELKQKVLAVATDYTCIPFWEETDCDWYISPHRDLIPEYVDRGMDEKRIYPFGIPVAMEFARHGDPKEARRRLGLDPDKPMYLIMGGSMGFGRMQAFAYELCRRKRKDEQVMIICGNNKRLYRFLTTELAGRENVRVMAFVNNVADYMEACDVLYTKPGGLTSTEALVKNVPFIHTAPIPGCESANMRFFNDNGLSLSSKGMFAQIDQGMRLMSSQEEREAMRCRQRAFANPEASKDILELIERECGERQ